MRRAHDGSAAIRRRTRLPFPIINTKAMLETALRAVDLSIIAERRATGFDRFLQHGADGVVQLFQTLRADAAGFLRWRNAGAVQRFDNIDVAEASDDALIQQRRLDARLLAGERVLQIRQMERVAERLR